MQFSEGKTTNFVGLKSILYLFLCINEAVTVSLFLMRIYVATLGTAWKYLDQNSSQVNVWPLSTD